MGTKKWSEIKTLSKANVADRAEARAELKSEIRSHSLAERRRYPPISQEVPAFPFDTVRTTNGSSSDAVSHIEGEG